MCLINQLDREAKQVEVTAKINEKEVPRGVVTGIELVSPSSDNLPEQSDFMSTEYKLKAITKDVEDSSQVKWCYAVLTDSEYRGKIKVSQVSESLSQTGEEIAFKPENILSESSKKKLSNKDVSAKLYIFAYMKSPAYYTKHGQTHVKCGIKKDFLCNTKAEIFPIKAVDNTDISILSAYTINILKQIGYESKLKHIRITSTMRTPHDQARIMYGNIKSDGTESQYLLYGSNGDKVIDVYVKNQDKDRGTVIKLMEKKILELGASKVSKHCLSDFSTLNVVDIGLGDMDDAEIESCREVIEKYEKQGLLKFINESKQNCYHLEIYQ